MIEESIAENTEALNRLARAVELLAKCLPAVPAFPAPVAEAPAESAPTPAPEAPKPSRGRPKKEAEAPAATPAQTPAPEDPKPAPAQEAPKTSIELADLRAFVKAKFIAVGKRDAYVGICTEVFGSQLPVDSLTPEQRVTLKAALDAALTKEEI